MDVKISELSELTSIDSNDRLIINHGNQTYQGSLSTIIGDYLSGYFGNYLSGYLSNNSYITEDYLSNNNYISVGYLSENSYITEEYLSGNIYINHNNLSDHLFGQSGYLNEIYGSNGSVNFEAIYQGISSYFET